VLSRSINPRIIDLDVTEALVRYRYPLEYLFGYPSGKTTAERQIVFQDVGRIEIFKNHTVLVRGSAGTMLAQFVFPTAFLRRTTRRRSRIWSPPFVPIILV
jgi:hypothetical protein